MQIDLRTGIAVVIVLLVAIVLLLLEKPKDRARTVGRFFIGLVVAYGAFKALPFAAALFGWLIVTVRGFGWQPSLRSGAVAAIIIVPTIALLAVARMLGLDSRDNRAIRNGSQEAFDRRVEDYVRVAGYSRDKAMATTERIRDGK